MRPASAVLEDLWRLIAVGQASGPMGRPEPLRPGALERWAIDCARRAVSANVESLRPQLRSLRAGLEGARARLQGTLDDDAWTELERRVGASQVPLDPRMPTRNSSRAAIHTMRAALTTQAVAAALRCVDERSGHDQVAALARRSFPTLELEADAQTRRLLLFTGLLPSGPDMLVRLDYAEGLGRLPSDPDQRAWIEDQRQLLMRDDEQGRMAMLIRHLELLFQVELERTRA